MPSDFSVASCSFENCEICTAVNLQCKLVARHAKLTEHRIKSKKYALYDAMASHRIGITVLTIGDLDSARTQRLQKKMD